jgi:hypothetical protein
VVHFQARLLGVGLLLTLITSYSSALIDTLKNASDPPRLAYFYFDFKSSETQTCYSLMRSLVLQLGVSSAENLDYLKREHTTPTGLMKASETHLSSMLQRLVRISGTVFFIIDALDECPEDERKGQLFPFLRNLRALDLQNLHFLFTSRPELNIETFMRGFCTHRLNIHGAQSHKDDLTRYISSRLYSPDAYQLWPARMKKKAQDILTEKANGM